MNWFGPSWGSHLNIEEDQVPVPVGQECAHCGEAIADGESGIFMMYLDHTGARRRPEHLECFMRQVVGSVAHQMRMCGCESCGSPAGAIRTDDPLLKKRENARLAYQYFLRNHPL